MLRKTGYAGSVERRTQRASMRPQRNAAENKRIGSGCCVGYVASMRPQRNAAENPARRPAMGGHKSRFNEAAA